MGYRDLPRHIISLGAGVQSSTMALMAAHGEIEPMPECAIFADTGWEPRAVYEWLAWLEARLPFPVHHVSAGNIREDQIANRQRGGRAGSTSRFASLPYYTKGEGDEREGRVRRQCTTEYKIEPIERFMRRELLGLEKGQRVPKGTEPLVQWRGISRDEASRMKPSRSPALFTVRYPLAIEHGMSRSDCLAWMQRNGYPQPPRSACIGCPFHSDHEWRRMRDETPDEWADAVELDKAIRAITEMGMQRPTYLHRQCVPLDEVDLSTAEERGQGTLFGEECEGMCGL